MAECEATLTIMNALNEINRAAAWLDDFTVQAGVPPEDASKLQVALDEILSNAFNHGLAAAPAAGTTLALHARRMLGAVELEVIDDGPFFDPTQAALSSKAERIAGQQVGGVGLLFIRALMDDVKYQRRGERNHLIVCKRLAGPA